MKRLSPETLAELGVRDKIIYYLGGRIAGITYEKLSRYPLYWLGAAMRLILPPRFHSYLTTDFLQREVFTLANLTTFYGLFLLWKFVHLSVAWISAGVTLDVYLPGTFLSTAFWLLIKIFLTDFVDGPLARINNRVSALGTFLDHFRDYAAAFAALGLLIAVTILFGDRRLIIYGTVAFLGFVGIIFYFLKLLVTHYRSAEFPENVRVGDWIKLRLEFLNNFALNEYQTELSGRVHFFVTALTICVGIFYYDKRTEIFDTIFNIAMAVNLVVTGIYLDITYREYGRALRRSIARRYLKLRRGLAQKNAELKEKVAEKKEISCWWWFPNFLTSVRILAATVFLILPQRYLAAAILIFLGAAITDLLDGRSARYLEVESKLGAELDPVADKLLIFSALYWLWPIVGFPVALLFLVLLPLEITSTLLRVFTSVDPKANVAGKIKAVFQMIAIPVMFLGLYLGNWALFYTGFVIGLISVTLSLGSILTRILSSENRSS